MGQYYTAANLDKRQFLSPHACDNGAKLLEFALSSIGMMSCLAILLADGNGRGGGDLYGPPCKKCKGRGSFGDLGDKNYRVCESCKGARNEPVSGLVGSWAGDRIVIAGDYADAKRFVSDEDQKAHKELALENGYSPEDADRDVNLYQAINEYSGWEDISIRTMQELAKDGYVRRHFEKESRRINGDNNRYDLILMR